MQYHQKNNEKAVVRQRRETLSVAEAGEILGISRSSAFQAAATGQLPVIRIGKRLLVSRASLERLLGAELVVD